MKVHQLLQIERNEKQKAQNFHFCKIKLFQYFKTVRFHVSFLNFSLICLLFNYQHFLMIGNE